MPKKRTRNLTSGFSCVTCNKDVEEHGVECQWCWQWEHSNCADLTSSECSVLSSSSAKIMFFLFIVLLLSSICIKNTR